jgi:DUF1365 family protein
VKEEKKHAATSPFQQLEFSFAPRVGLPDRKFRFYVDVVSRPAPFLIAGVRRPVEVERGNARKRQLCR